MSDQPQGLKTFHTKQLMGMLDDVRRYDSYVDQNIGDELGVPSYEFQAIKAELATREHIPNKKEAKAVRQAAAKKGR